MSFIVLEVHGGPENAVIVTDENGNNKIFEEFSDAQLEAQECQEGIIVGI